MQATTTARSMFRRRRFDSSTTTSSSLLVGFFVLLGIIAVTPRSCDAVSPWKNAEDKLREQGLLHGDTTPLPEEEDDGGGGGGGGDVTGEGGAASGVGEDGKPLKVSPAEASYKEAKKLLSDFDSKARRKAKAFALLKTAIKLDPKHRGALLLMGRAYQMGEGVDADEAQAVRYFEMAADLGDPGAHEELGFVYSVGWVGIANNPFSRSPSDLCKNNTTQHSLITKKKKQQRVASSPALSTPSNLFFFFFSFFLQPLCLFVCVMCPASYA